MNQTIGIYNVLDSLNHGEGSETDVYRVSGHDERICTLKVSKVPVSEDPDFAADMEEISKVANSLSHENIAPIYDFFISDDKVCVVREFSNSTLEDFLWDKSRRLSYIKLLDMFVQICKGISCLHQNEVVHRGIKPQNILIIDSDTAKVADFGLSGIISEESFSRVSNKFSYMSPEQLQARKVLIGSEASSEAQPVTSQTDIYSLGLLLYEMLSASALFPEEDLEEAHKARLEYSFHTLGRSNEIPEELKNVLKKALAVNPSLRYSSVAEMSLEIEKFLDGYWESFSKAGLVWYQISDRFPFIAQTVYFLNHVLIGFAIHIGSWILAFLGLLLPLSLTTIVFGVGFLESINGSLIIVTALASFIIALFITGFTMMIRTRLKNRVPEQLSRLSYFISILGFIVLIYIVNVVFIVESQVSLATESQASNESKYAVQTNLIGSVNSIVAVPVPTVTPLPVLIAIVDQTPTPSPTNTASPTPKINPTFTVTPTKDRPIAVNHALTRVPTPLLTPTVTLTPTATNTPTPSPTPSPTSTLTPVPVPGDPFTIGSTREQVIAAQGYCPNYEPTDNYPSGHLGAYGNIERCPGTDYRGQYYFGSSSVTFKKPFDLNSKTVSFWMDNGDLNLADHVPDGKSFDIGSTRPEVFQSSGPADWVEGPYGLVWHYGEDSITFKYSSSAKEVIVIDYTNYDCRLKLDNNQCFSGSEPIVFSGYPYNSTNTQSFWIKDIPWSIEGTNMTSLQIDLLDIKNEKKVSSFNPIIDVHGTIPKQPMYVPQGGYYFQITIPDSSANDSWDIKIRKEYDTHDGVVGFVRDEGDLEKFTPIFTYTSTEITVGALKTNYIGLYKGETGKLFKEIQEYESIARPHNDTTFNLAPGKYYFHVIGDNGWYLNIKGW